MKNRMPIILICFFLILGITFFYFVIPYINKNEEKKPVLPIIGVDQNHHIQPFTLINQEGKPFTEKAIAGKICVVEYFFASCKGMCPKMNENMRLVYEKYKDNKNVLILSHTVDPEKDSAA